eukprot:TRINITY_DN2810_c0_g1_i1.p1 TRINITY_DN2810_c0_g1~~TRINITY_DN2810_c0_g1_i1.p1  ORF type:complete len:1540 (+),score=321.57 TRINITY_DN2810_c0_g1_i1:43-4662(+)
MEAGVEEAPLVPLILFWHAERCDHMLVASPDGTAYAQANGYALMRTVGLVRRDEAVGTKPLVQMYHSGMQDHALAIYTDDLGKRGYVRERVEGHAYEFKDLVPGSVLLATYHCEARCDTVGIADSATAEDVLKRRDYTLRKIEARIIPQAKTPRASPLAQPAARPRPVGDNRNGKAPPDLPDMLPLNVVNPSPQSSLDTGRIHPLCVSEKTLETWLMPPPRDPPETDASFARDDPLDVTYPQRHSPLSARQRINAYKPAESAHTPHDTAPRHSNADVQAHRWHIGAAARQETPAAVSPVDRVERPPADWYPSNVARTTQVQLSGPVDSPHGRRQSPARPVRSPPKRALGPQLLPRDPSQGRASPVSPVGDTRSQSRQSRSRSSSRGAAGEPPQEGHVELMAATGAPGPARGGSVVGIGWVKSEGCTEDTPLRRGSAGSRFPVSPITPKDNCGHTVPQRTPVASLLAISKRAPNAYDDDDDDDLEVSFNPELPPAQAGDATRVGSREMDGSCDPLSPENTPAHAPVPPPVQLVKGESLKDLTHAHSTETAGVWTATRLRQCGGRDAEDPYGQHETSLLVADESGPLQSELPKPEEGRPSRSSLRQRVAPPLSIDTPLPGSRRRASTLHAPLSVPTNHSSLCDFVRVEKPNLLELDKLSTEHLEALTQAVVRIQKIFRGHSDRLRFKTGLARIAKLVDQVVVNDAAEKNVHQLEAAVGKMEESLLTHGFTTPGELSELRQQAARLKMSYQTITEEAAQRKRKANARLDRIKEVVGVGSDKGVQSNVMRVIEMVLAWIRSFWFIGMLCWLTELAIGAGDGNEEDMDSQQTAWQTEPVFRAIVEGDFAEFEKIMTQQPVKAHARDHFGATPLLVAMLINRTPQRSMVQWLLRKNPALAQDAYFTDLFKGEIALHFAIVHRDMPAVNMLLKAYPEGLFKRATGAFFQDREGGCYFGEWPLMFAVATNQPDLVMRLIDHGERLGKRRAELLDIRDTDANTLLHICVWHNLPDMYSFIEALCKESDPLPGFYESGLSVCFNKDGLTPFSLSAERGNVEMFAHLLEANTQVTWKYGAHSFRAVFIDEIESGFSDKPSILEILVEKEHEKLLDLPLVRNFLEKKWTKFVQRVFFRRIFMIVVYVFFFLMSLVTESHSKPHAGHCLPHLEPLWPFYEREGFLEKMMRFDTVMHFGDERKVDFTDVVQGAVTDWCLCEFNQTFVTSWSLFASRLSNTVVLLGALWKARRELGELQEGGLQAYFGVKGSMLLENVLASSFCLFIILTYLFRLLGWEAENLTGAMSALLLWSYVLWLMLGFKTTGPFIIMIWKMLADDMIQFLVIFLTFQLGFTQAFHLVLHSEGSQEEEYTPFLAHLKTSFEVLLGEINLDVASAQTPYPLIAYVLNVVYAVLVTILLLNLLISKMSTTYSIIEQESDAIWNLEFSRMILSLEGEISSEEKMNLRWWSVIDGRRCFMLPVLTESGKQQYWDSYKPNWDVVRKHKKRPASFRFPTGKGRPQPANVSPTRNRLASPGPEVSLSPPLRPLLERR